MKTTTFYTVLLIAAQLTSCGTKNGKGVIFGQGDQTTQGTTTLQGNTPIQGSPPIPDTTTTQNVTTNQNNSNNQSSLTTNSTTTLSEEKSEEKSSDDNVGNIRLTKKELKLISDAKHRNTNNCHCYKNDMDTNSKCVRIESDIFKNNELSKIGSDFSHENLDKVLGITTSTIDNIGTINSKLNELITKFYASGNSPIIELYDYALEKLTRGTLIWWIYWGTEQKNREFTRILPSLVSLIYSHLENFAKKKKTHGYNLNRRNTVRKVISMSDKLAYILEHIKWADACTDEYNRFFSVYKSASIVKKDYLKMYYKNTWGYEFIERSDFFYELVDLPIVRNHHLDKDKKNVLIISTKSDKSSNKLASIRRDITLYNPELNKLCTNNNVSIEYIGTEKDLFDLENKMKEKAQKYNNNKKFDFLISLSHGDQQAITFYDKKKSFFMIKSTSEFIANKRKTNDLRKLFDSLLNKNSHMLLSACFTGKPLSDEKKKNHEILISEYLCALMPGNDSTITAATELSMERSLEPWDNWVKTNGKKMEFVYEKDNKKFFSKQDIFQCNKSQAEKNLLEAYKYHTKKQNEKNECIDASCNNTNQDDTDEKEQI